MNKKLKAQLIRKNEEMRMAFPNLYDLRWVGFGLSNKQKQRNYGRKENDYR